MCIVSDKNFTVKSSEYFFRHFFERRSVQNHLGRNSCESRYVIGDISLRVDQGVKHIGDVKAIVLIDSHLSYAMVFGVPTRCFDIHNRVRGCKLEFDFFT